MDAVASSLARLRKIQAMEQGLFARMLTAQAALETGFRPGGCPGMPGVTPQPSRNLTGLSPGGRLAHYASWAFFIAAEVDVLSLPFYVHVRSATNPDAWALAMGQSPWSQSHYAASGRPGGLLLDVLSRLSGAPTPQAPEEPAPSPLREDMAQLAADLERAQAEVAAVEKLPGA
jgi:hypothetical protein